MASGTGVDSNQAMTTPTALAKRLAVIEARVGPLRPEPPDVPPWLKWVSNEELNELELIARSEAYWPYAPISGVD
jgi:hypothetical protein